MVRRLRGGWLTVGEATHHEAGSDERHEVNDQVVPGRSRERVAEVARREGCCRRRRSTRTAWARGTRRQDGTLQRRAGRALRAPTSPDCNCPEQLLRGGDRPSAEHAGGAKGGGATLLLGLER